jgi:hypothetical protein
MKIKKKDIFIAALIIILLTAIVGGCIFLASRRDNTAPQKAINLYRPSRENTIIYDRFGIHVINPEIPDINTLSVDLSEFGIDNGYEVLRAGNVDGINLYLCHSYYAGLTESETLFFRYNLITSQVSKIELTSNYDTVSYYNFYAHGGYLYYFAWNTENRLSTGLEPGYLCRVPVSGGKEETLAEYTSGSEHIVCVAGDTVITSNGSKISSYDVSKKKKSELFNAEKSGFRLLLAERSYYYDGKLYFKAEKDMPSILEADEGFKEDWKTPDDYLIALDIKSKKWEKVFDFPVSLFCVTEDRIYYVKKKYRLIPLKEFALSINDVFIAYVDSSICSQPIGGGEESVNYTNENISINEIFSIKDGKMCCMINSSNKTYYDYGIRFATIDFTTGNITEFDMQE